MGGRRKASRVEEEIVDLEMDDFPESFIDPLLRTGLFAKTQSGKSYMTRYMVHRMDRNRPRPGRKRFFNFVVSMCKTESGSGNWGGPALDNENNTICERGMIPKLWALPDYDESVVERMMLTGGKCKELGCPQFQLLILDDVAEAKGFKSSNIMAEAMQNGRNQGLGIAIVCHGAKQMHERARSQFHFVLIGNTTNNELVKLYELFGEELFERFEDFKAAYRSVMALCGDPEECKADPSKRQYWFMVLCLNGVGSGDIKGSVFKWRAPPPPPSHPKGKWHRLGDPIYWKLSMMVSTMFPVTKMNAFGDTLQQFAQATIVAQAQQQAQRKVQHLRILASKRPKKSASPAVTGGTSTRTGTKRSNALIDRSDTRGSTLDYNDNEEDDDGDVRTSGNDGASIASFTSTAQLRRVGAGPQPVDWPARTSRPGKANPCASLAF